MYLFSKAWTFKKEILLHSVQNISLRQFSREEIKVCHIYIYIYSSYFSSTATTMKQSFVLSCDCTYSVKWHRRVFKKKVRTGNYTIRFCLLHPLASVALGNWKGKLYRGFQKCRSLNQKMCLEEYGSKVHVRKESVLHKLLHIFQFLYALPIFSHTCLCVFVSFLCFDTPLDW